MTFTHRLGECFAPTFKICEIGEDVFIIGKALELMGLSFLAVGLYIGCAKPYGLSDGKAMEAEMGSLVAGIIIFLIGRFIEKR